MKEALPLLAFLNVANDLGRKYSDALSRAASGSGGRPSKWTLADQQKLSEALKRLVDFAGNARERANQMAEGRAQKLREMEDALTPVINSGLGSTECWDFAVADFGRDDDRRRKYAGRLESCTPYTSLTRPPKLTRSTVTALRSAMRTLSTGGQRYTADTKRGKKLLELTEQARERTGRDAPEDSFLEPALAKLGISMIFLNNNALLRPQFSDDNILSSPAAKLAKDGLSLDNTAYQALGILAAGVPFGTYNPPIHSEVLRDLDVLHQAVSRGEALISRLTGRQENPAPLTAEQRAYFEPLYREIAATRPRKSDQIGDAVFRYGQMYPPHSRRQVQDVRAFMTGLGFGDYTVFLEPGYQHSLDDLQEALLVSRSDSAEAISYRLQEKGPEINARWAEISGILKAVEKVMYGDTDFPNPGVPRVYDRDGRVNDFWRDYVVKARIPGGDRPRVYQEFQELLEEQDELRKKKKRMEMRKEDILALVRTPQNEKKARVDAEILARYYVAVELWELICAGYVPVGERLGGVLDKATYLYQAAQVARGKNIDLTTAAQKVQQVFFANPIFREILNEKLASQYAIWLDTSTRSGLPFTGYEQVKYISEAVGLPSLVEAVTGNPDALRLGEGESVREAGLPALLYRTNEQTKLAVLQAETMAVREIEKLERLRAKVRQQDLDLINEVIRDSAGGARTVDVNALRERMLRSRRMTAEEFEDRITPLTREVADRIVGAASLSVETYKSSPVKMLTDEADWVATDVYRFSCLHNAPVEVTASGGTVTPGRQDGYAHVLYGFDPEELRYYTVPVAEDGTRGEPSYLPTSITRTFEDDVLVLRAKPTQIGFPAKAVKSLDAEIRRRQRDLEQVYSLRVNFTPRFFEDVFKWLNYTTPVAAGFPSREPNPSQSRLEKRPWLAEGRNRAVPQRRVSVRSAPVQEYSDTRRLKRALRVQREPGSGVVIPTLPYQRKLWFRGLDEETKSKLQRNVLARRDRYIEMLRPGSNVARQLEKAHPWLYRGDSFNYYNLERLISELRELYGEFMDAEQDAYDDTERLIFYQLFDNTGIERFLYDPDALASGGWGSVFAGYWVVDGDGGRYRVEFRSDEDRERAVERVVLLNPTIIEMLFNPDSAESYFLSELLSMLPPPPPTDEEEIAAQGALRRMLHILRIETAIQSDVREPVENYNPPTALARDIFNSTFCLTQPSDNLVEVHFSEQGAIEAFDFLTDPKTAEYIRTEAQVADRAGNRLEAESKALAEEWLLEARETAAIIARGLASLRGGPDPQYRRGLGSARRRRLQELR